MTATVVSESLIEIPLDHSYEIIGCLTLRWERLLTLDQNMKSQVAFDQFSHQSIQCPATGGDELQDVFAFAVSFKGTFDGFDLAFDSPNSREGLYLIFCCVRQRLSPLSTILPYIIFKSIGSGKCWKPNAV